MLELQAWAPGSILCRSRSASVASRHKQVIFTVPQSLLTQIQHRVVQSLHPQVTASDVANDWSNAYLFIWFCLFFVFLVPWASTLKSDRELMYTVCIQANSITKTKQKHKSNQNGSLRDKLKILPSSSFIFEVFSIFFPAQHTFWVSLNSGDSYKGGWF